MKFDTFFVLTEILKCHSFNVKHCKCDISPVDVYFEVYATM